MKYFIVTLILILLAFGLMLSGCKKAAEEVSKPPVEKTVKTEAEKPAEHTGEEAERIKEGEVESESETPGAQTTETEEEVMEVEKKEAPKKKKSH